MCADGSENNYNGEMPVRSSEKEEAFGCCKDRDGEGEEQKDYAEKGFENSIPDLRGEGRHGIGAHINEGYGEESLENGIIDQLNATPDTAYAHNAVINDL